jgi:hypothetical protein
VASRSNYQQRDSLLDWRGKMLNYAARLIGRASLNAIIGGSIYFALLALYKKESFIH